MAIRQKKSVTYRQTDLRLTYRHRVIPGGPSLLNIDSTVQAPKYFYLKKSANQMMRNLSMEIN